MSWGNEISRRLRWVKMYLELGDAGVVCRRCGVSRPTLRKWVRRFEAHGEVGLGSLSRRPRSSLQKLVLKRACAKRFLSYAELGGSERGESKMNSSVTIAFTCRWPRFTKF